MHWKEQMFVVILLFTIAWKQEIRLFVFRNAIIEDNLASGQSEMSKYKNDIEIR